jgi:Fe-S cluster biogenesis protein NfuA
LRFVKASPFFILDTESSILLSTTIFRLDNSCAILYEERTSPAACLIKTAGIYRNKRPEWRLIVALTRDRVEKALEQTRSVLRNDGGDVELVDVSDDGVVQVRLKGSCHGCPMATMTLKSLIERVLKKEIPDVKEVKAVA